mgnify:CR=1 FL=1
MRPSNRRGIKNIDWVLVLLYFLLVAFGWFNIYAANSEPGASFTIDTNKEYFKQLIWIGISIISIGVILLIDSKFFVEFSYIFYIISVFLLFIVIFIGVEVNAAKSWFQVGGMRFQPVEIAKVAMALTMARVMSRFQFSFKKLNDVFTLGILWVLPMIIIILQNDTGSALIFFAFALVFFREGMSPYFILFGIIAIAVFIATLLISNNIILLILFLSMIVHLLYKRVRKEAAIMLSVFVITFFISYLIFHQWLNKENLFTPLFIAVVVSSLYLLVVAFIQRAKVFFISLLLLWGSIGFAFSTDYFTEEILSDYQRTRIQVMLGLKDDPLGAGYNVHQSKIAIGSGGFLGKGFMQGTQTKFNFVPEQSTDFIFCTVGEEWGLLGTAGVIILFSFFIVRIIILSEKQYSDFSRIYGYGVASIFLIHFAINIGMTIGLAPVIGIPLPFFSYGGSSLWGFTILLFIFVKLDTNRAQLIR